MQKFTLSITLFFIFFFPTWTYAESITFDEVQSYLDNKISVHDPGDPSISIKPYDYPALDILPLWNKLGFDWQKIAGQKDASMLFGCKQEDTKCLVKNPKLTIYSRKEIRIIGITESFHWDLQYLVFKNGIYIGHFEDTMQKYEVPKLIFLDDDMFSVKVLYMSGSGILGYWTEIYQIDDKAGFKMVLAYITQYERYGWGVPFDIEINSKSSYRNGQLKLKYRIKVMQGYVTGVNEEALVVPIVKDSRKITYNRTKDGFAIDAKSSDIKPDAIEEFDEKPISLYMMYKAQFDRIKEVSRQDQQWYDDFIKYIN